MTTPYWNPRTETLPREQLEVLQVTKLRALVAWTLAALWQVANGAGLQPGQVYDAGA
jgi:phenylacetate-CoA ligase